MPQVRAQASHGMAPSGGTRNIVTRLSALIGHSLVHLPAPGRGWSLHKTRKERKTEKREEGKGGGEEKLKGRKGDKEGGKTGGRKEGKAGFRKDALEVEGASIMSVILSPTEPLLGWQDFYTFQGATETHLESREAKGCGSCSPYGFHCYIKMKCCPGLLRCSHCVQPGPVPQDSPGKHGEDHKECHPAQGLN